MGKVRQTCTHANDPCVACVRAHKKMDNKNAARARNRDAENSAARARYAADPEKARARTYRWLHKQHPAKRAQIQASAEGFPWAAGQLPRAIEMWDSAEHCKICRKQFGEQRKKCLDHDHKTGLVRGVVCHKCNSGLGMLEDSPALVQAAYTYLVPMMESVDYVWDSVSV